MSATLSAMWRIPRVAGGIRLVSATGLIVSHMRMGSRYEKNIRLQPELIRQIMAAPLPSWMEELKKKRFFFVGVGSSFHAAQIASILWRRHVSPQAWAEHSFDFVSLPQPIASGDVAVLLSHRGGRSYTVQAASVARRAKAVPVAMTGHGAIWGDSIAHRLETCEAEDSGVYTKSVISSLVWIARWIGEAGMIEGLRRACISLEAGPRFPSVAFGADLVFLGDLEREWVARETSLKVLEAAYYPARAFGLEEFLHGPHVSVGPKTMVVAFSGLDPRWKALRDYLQA